MEVIEQSVKRSEQQWIGGAAAALNVFRADTPRVADFKTIQEWVDEPTLCRTGASFIRQAFQSNGGPPIACCQAGRAIVNDYYSRPPLFHECVSDIIKNSLREIIGGALFAPLQPAPQKMIKSIKSNRR